MKVFENKKKLYWIGGSPCCGKSTIAEMLVKDFGFEYYKCDDFLEDYVHRGKGDNIEIMEKYARMNLDETWLRPIEDLVNDEFLFYREAFAYIKEDLDKIVTDKAIVVEGAALLPDLIQENGFEMDSYMCIVPTKTFQLEKYKERKWVCHYLKGSSNPEKAFENWMNRDVDFAKQVKKCAEVLGLNVMLVDGSKSIEENYGIVCRYFGLEAVKGV